MKPGFILALGAASLLLMKKKAPVISPSPPSLPGTSERSLDFGPPHPGFGVLSPAARDQRFGPLSFVDGPDGSLELEGPGPPLTRIRTHAPPGLPQELAVHVDAAPSAQRAFDELRDRGIQIQDVGALNIRKARGQAFPSAHAYGTAVDINARENPQGSLPTRQMGEIARAFVRQGGWYWGGWFRNPDPHHLEFTGQNTHDAPNV